MRVSGNIVDVLNSEIYPGTLEIEDGKIVRIKKEEKEYENYILPGFVDSHVHIESSMLTPSEFARVSVTHGTVAVVADPHEIANVLGIEGIKYMIKDSEKVPMKFFFGIPSCVPATPFESSGAVLNSKKIENLMEREDIRYLGEMMNFPGVINKDSEVLKKIEIAKKYNKPVDGHAPGLKGENLKTYIEVGISTDHECSSREEALEKIEKGMKIQIREGSAAKNFEELVPLIKKNYKNCMFCSDDKHLDELIKGHINKLVKRALDKGIDLFKVLKVACVNPIFHYGLNVGLLQENDDADFIIVDNLKNFNILETYIRGKKVSERGNSLIDRKKPEIVNNFNIRKKKPEEFSVNSGGNRIKVMGALGTLLNTEKLIKKPKVINNEVVSDVEKDILKVAVVNRYKDFPSTVGFIKGFGLKEGAIASSVAHDSHNIVAVGVDNEKICRAVNLVIENKGGLSVVGKDEKVLPLPIAGLISDESYDKVAEKYLELNRETKELGCELKAPFMILSFMALPVIPKLKITDKGLFDVEKFEFVDLFE